MRLCSAGCWVLWVAVDATEHPKRNATGRKLHRRRMRISRGGGIDRTEALDLTAMSEKLAHLSGPVPEACSMVVARTRAPGPKAALQFR